MVQHTKYEAGTPSWADIASPDLEASRAFYGALFGWTGEPSPEPEAHSYTVFMKGDDTVAGLGPLFDDSPPVWSTYVTVADVDETVAETPTAGGQVLMEPMDVLDAGRMAVIADPTGAALSLWQPREHIGAEVRMEPGAMCWVELNTREPDKVVGFFEKLFGWKAQQISGTVPNAPSCDGSTTSSTEMNYDYIMLQLGDTPIGGIITMDDNWPAEVPPHWMVYFAVTDCDATAAQVTELGGKVCVPPTDIPPGRFAVVNDPHGAVFTIIALNPEMFE